MKRRPKYSPEFRQREPGWVRRTPVASWILLLLARVLGSQSVESLELAGWYVCEGAVQAALVEPTDVLD